MSFSNNIWNLLENSKNKTNTAEQILNGITNSGIAAVIPKNEEEIKDTTNGIIPGSQEAAGEVLDEIIKDTPIIQDKTEENIEIGINNENWLEWAEQQQQKQWQREDEIRKETQEREDTAYQRAVEDMLKAGINPNLVNVSAAESGGGITSASGMNTSIYENAIKQSLAELESAIEKEFEGKQNDKDRFTGLIETVIQSIIAGMILKK